MSARKSVVFLAVLFFLACSCLVPPTFGQATLVDGDADIRYGDSRSDDRSRYDTDSAIDQNDPRRLEMYEQVLKKLQDMRLSKSKAVVRGGDDQMEKDDENDWYVVGGSLWDSSDGSVEAAFTSFQGAENVAQRIVDFASGSYASQVPSWNVYQRYSNGEDAEAAADRRLVNFQRHLARQARAARRSQVARSRRASSGRTRGRSGGC